MNSYGKGELYNLKKDPYEINNLFGNPKLIDKQSELLTKLLAWELRLQDPLPLPRHRYHFSGTLITIILLTNEACIQVVSIEYYRNRIV